MYNLSLENFYDRIIGNPPYNRGLLKKFWKRHFNIQKKVKSDIGPALQYPHCAMMWLCHRILKEYGLLTFVLPTNWMTLNSYSKFIDWMLKNFIVKKIHIYDNSKKEVFDINMGDVVVLHIVKCNDEGKCLRANKDVIWQYNNETPFSVDLTKHPFIPLYEKPEDVTILEKVVSNKIDNVCERKKSKFFIEGAILGLNKSMEHSKTWTKNKLHPSKTKFTMFFNNQQDLDNYYSWTKTSEYNFSLSLLKSSPKHQPTTLDYIGLQDFVNLKFTQKEKERIQRWRP